MKSIEKNTISILLKDFKNQSVEKHIDPAELSCDNIVESNNISSNNQDNRKENSIYNSSNNDINDTSSLSEDIFCSKRNTVIENVDNISNNIPPVPPNLPIFSYDQQSQQFDQSSCSTSTFNPNDILHSSSFIIKPTVDLHAESSSNSSVKLCTDNDFCQQLSMQKKSKFSSIGTQEYIEKLENSLLARKKDKKVTDIEKMFNKLHIVLSQSSIAESVDTNDDSIDSFSESSNF